MLPVLHGAARAITPNEFAEALYAISPPRFPSARAVRHRAVSLAISGGVDSMALAYLCSRVRRMDAWLKLADHPVKHFVANIVDHRLRPGSGSEALAVARVLRTRLDIPAEVHQVRWDRELGHAADTSQEALGRMPNIESLARRMRYRLLARFCKQADITSILLAHHEDDQYETVLMRLMTGHGTRGLRGIRPATDIPECSDLHGVYQSGFIDDLRRVNPMYNIGITRRERKYLKHLMRTEIDPALMAREMHDGLYEEGMGRHPYLYGYMDERETRKRTAAPPLEPMDIEDGGVQIYRPLLGFSKERLIATCLHNDIPWFEDATNSDPTLTMRNAVRHLVRNHELPIALRKPAVLRLAERCRAKVADDDEQAERLLERVTIHDFEPNAGTLVVQLPELRTPTVPRRVTALRREKRREQYARIAGILVQKLLALVTPEQQLTPLKDLGWVTTRLFPSLSDAKVVDEPKAFTICGVHLVPVPGPPLRWYLSRAPHASLQPRPVMQINKQVYTRRWRTTPRKWVFSRWSNWALFDNRFWVSLRCRVPFDVTVAPFEPEYAKAFREAMGPQGKAMLDAALRKYAPGKVRYTLPALYVRGDIGALIKGEEDWKIHDAILEGRDAGDDPDDMVELGDGHRLWKDRQKVTRCRPPFLRQHAWTRDQMKEILDEKVRLVALPTLGIGLPGIESWVEWSFRYRKVELGTLALATGVRYARRRKIRQRIRLMRMRMQGRGTRSRARRK
ncbi:Adenine nucleotide alpha hydrolases-like protein [Coniochaeta hoffmannii]|uniref:tRNA(Ile)-lysidine synthetase n=1 Tax=Coniochaeta hoffmannii TaxID=91930 RepID=A0AA38S217_9PEZI|nr:Adenine nucleotide alpha hydrolases-like protein [Coniochaeta hoffmannii]